jgi:hypothetical protein
VLIQGGPVKPEGEGKHQFFQQDTEDKDTGDRAEIPNPLDISRSRGNESSEIEEIQVEKEHSADNHLSLEIRPAVPGQDPACHHGDDGIVDGIQIGAGEEDDE